MSWRYYRRCVEADLDSTWFAITSESIDPTACVRWLGDPVGGALANGGASGSAISSAEHGAQVCFFGAIRDFNQGKKVLAVSYDVHEKLALSVFDGLCGAARDRWGADLRIAILHRQGKLEVGEIAVAILVSSRHRREAYEASRFLIEEIKHSAPIWKKEFYEGGESGWVQGHSLCQHGAASGDPSGRSIEPHGPR